MASIEVRDAAGKKVGTRDLPAEIFESKVSVPLMHQVVVAGLAGIRAGTHSTKTRGEVRGGGRKPWRQKGTGRSRQGSIRSPQWVGGGAAHGPTPRDHSQRVNKKMRRGALRSALTDALQSGKLAVIDDLMWDEPKTKQAAGILDSLELAGRVLLVLPAPSEPGAVEKSFRNIANVKIAYARGLGTYDVLLADRVLFTGAALDGLAEEPKEKAQKATPTKAPPTKATEKTEVAESIKSARDVIVRPVVSEKSYAGIERNTYTFLVDPRANKTEIKEAIQQIWDVRVLSVNTLKRRGKMKRRGFSRGRRPDEKRAVVTLAQGDSIEIFEGGS